MTDEQKEILSLKKEVHRLEKQLRYFKQLVSDDGKNNTDKADIDARLMEHQHLEAIGQLACGVAHDLNNLLVPIITYSELLLDELKEDESLFWDIEQILESAHYARDITAQLLLFCKRQQPAASILNLNNSIAGAKKMLQRLLRENINFKLKLDSQLGTILADQAQIDQILINMAVNAKDAMPDGGNFVIETANVDVSEIFAAKNPGLTAGSWIMMAFSDTGCGISKETLLKIFDRFFTTKKKQGTGLGLSTVKEIVNSLGGYIKVISEPGKGTCFKIFIPRNDNKLPEPVMVKSSDIQLGNGEWILVTENEDVIRQLICRILSKYGYNIIQSATGEEGLNITTTQTPKPDLLLTDLVLPGISGNTYYKKMASLIPEIKVLYMSGYDKDEIDRDGIFNEKYNFLKKPFSVKSLTVAVRNALDTTF
jgi:signal transduction histidine kinase/CheY-like chemotaxis protein